MNNFIELLSTDELQAFRDYGAEMDGVCPPSLSNEVLFAPWNEAKQDLYRLFGNNFIINRTVKLKRDNTQIESDMASNVLYDKNGEYYNIPNTIKDISFSSVFNGTDIGKELRTCLIPRILVSNRWPGEDFVIPAHCSPKGKAIKIQKGMKIVKIFEKVLKAFDKYDAEEFEAFRIAHSLCLNETDYDGELCLSIHPLDYATMSDNACGWDSCMRWCDGEHHQGTVEMMNSKYMVVAYLTSSRPFYLAGTDMRWHNKKWRKLYIVSPEIIMGIKAYPYFAEELELTVLDWLKELAEVNLGWEYFDDKQKVSNFQDNHCPNHLLKQFRLELMMNHMFSDIRNNHWAYLSRNENLIFPVLQLTLSGKSECLCCGNTDFTNIESYSLACHHCGDFSQCPMCGCWYSDGYDSWHDYNDEMICQCCWEELQECHKCGKLQSYNETKEICITYRVQWWFDLQPTERTSEIFLCTDCYENLIQLIPMKYPDDGYDLTQMSLEEFKKLLSFFQDDGDYEVYNQLIKLWNYTYPEDKYEEE